MAFVAAPELFAGAGDGVVAGVTAGLLAGVVLAAGVDVGAVAAGLPAGVAFFARLFLVVLVSALAVPSAGAAVLLDAALSVLVPFFARLFFVVLVSALAVRSAASALAPFFARLFLGAVVASAGAVFSLLAAVFFFACEVFVEFVLASALLCAASAAAFFLLFFFVVVLVSVWSVELEEPACCAPRVLTLPQISSNAASHAKTTPLLDLILLPPSATGCRAKPNTPHLFVWGWFRPLRSWLCGISVLECGHHGEEMQRSQECSRVAKPRAKVKEWMEPAGINGEKRKV